MPPKELVEEGRRAVLPALIKSIVGIRRADGTVAIARREKPGIFLYGPYWRLVQGRYRLEFTCMLEQPLDARAVFLGVEVLAQNRTFLAVRDYCPAELCDGRGSIFFDVPAALAESDGGAFFEFRFLNFALADFAVTDVNLASTDTAPDPSPLHWRLVSRLQPGMLARRERGGLRLVIGWFGGRIFNRMVPWLMLPAGTFRLSVRTSLPVGKRASRFGVTLRLGRGVTVSREFAAHESSDGRHEITFGIADDHSVDDGQGLSIALWQGRGASLTVHEVDITQVTERSSVRPDIPAPALVTRMAARVVIVGNCQAEVLAYGLRTMLGWRSLKVHYHFVGHQAKLHDTARRELLDCDLLFAGDISDFATYSLRAEIPQRVVVLRFPMLRLSTPWPFDAHNGLRDSQAELREAEDPTFPNLDGVLARLRRDIPDREARFAAYAGLELDWIVDVRRMASFESRRLLAMDRQHGCDLGARILEGYRRRPMFHSIGHPGGELLISLLRHMCRIADLRPGWLRAGSMDPLHNIQIPIHPLIAERLGISWATHDTRYNFRGEKLTWEQYTRRYIEHFG